jgi:hypothetical protein
MHLGRRFSDRFPQPLPDITLPGLRFPSVIRFPAGPDRGRLQIHSTKCLERGQLGQGHAGGRRPVHRTKKAQAGPGEEPGKQTRRLPNHKRGHRRPLRHPFGHASDQPSLGAAAARGTDHQKLGPFGHGGGHDFLIRDPPPGLDPDLKIRSAPQPIGFRLELALNQAFVAEGHDHLPGRDPIAAAKEQAQGNSESSGQSGGDIGGGGGSRRKIGGTKNGHGIQGKASRREAAGVPAVPPDWTVCSLTEL